MDIDFSKFDLDDGSVTEDISRESPVKEKIEPEIAQAITLDKGEVSKIYWLHRFKVFSFVIILAICSFTFLHLFIKVYTVQGSSMEPTFKHGDVVVVESISTSLNLLDRGDIVAFIDVRDISRPYLVKRIIALPGERVRVSTTTQTLIEKEGGNIYVLGSDGEMLLDNFRTMVGGTILGPEDYFFMGDNLVASKDSRKFGTIQPSEMLGKVLYKF